MKRLSLFLIVVLIDSGPCFAQATPLTPTPTSSSVSATKPATKSSTKPEVKSAAVATSKEAQVPTRPVDPVVLSNQMMITAGERIKAGAFPEAKQVAQDMIYGYEKFATTSQTIAKSFSSLMEKKLFEEMMRREGRQEPVIWVQQPIADGFYFLAIIAFEEKKTDEALDYIQKAIDWDPVRAAFYIERGFINVQSGKNMTIAEISASYLKALELADGPEDFAAALRGLGFLFVEQGDWEGALASYLVSLFFDPQNSSAQKEIEFIRYNNPGIYKEINANKAVQILVRRKVPVRIDPIHVQNLLKIADELSSTKQTKEIKAVLKRALNLDPKNESIKKRLAGIK